MDEESAKHLPQDLNRLRNAIHNEAGITKQEIREMVESAVKSLVDKRVKQLLPDELSLDRLVDAAILNRSLYWSSRPESPFNDVIEKRVAQILASKLKVEVVKK
jgi:hypothetical protein